MDFVDLLNTLPLTAATPLRAVREKASTPKPSAVRNNRLFDSVARVEADIDIDIMVDLLAEHLRSTLLRISGLNVGAREIIERSVGILRPR